MRHLVDNDVFFAAMYGKHALHGQCRRWLDGAKADGWGVAAEAELAGRYPGRVAWRKAGLMPAWPQHGRIASSGSPDPPRAGVSIRLEPPAGPTSTTY